MEACPTGWRIANVGRRFLCPRMGSVSANADCTEKFNAANWSVTKEPVDLQRPSRAGDHAASRMLRLNSEKISSREKRLVGAVVRIVEDRVEKFALALEHLVDPLLDCVECQESRDGDGPLHADPMGPIDRLVFDSRIPPAVEQKDIAGELQIQPHAAGAVGHQDDLAVGIVAELRDQRRRVAVIGYLAVIFERLEPRRAASVISASVCTHWLKTIAFRPLAAHSSKSVSSRSSLLLVPVVGSKLQICLSRKHELEYMLDGQFALHLPKPHDALVLGAADRTRLCSGDSSISASRNNLGGRSVRTLSLVRRST